MKKWMGRLFLVVVSIRPRWFRIPSPRLQTISYWRHRSRSLQLDLQRAVVVPPGCPEEVPSLPPVHAGQVLPQPRIPNLGTEQTALEDDRRLFQVTTVCDFRPVLTPESYRSDASFYALGKRKKGVYRETDCALYCSDTTSAVDRAWGWQGSI